jgi:hypothetical protein
MDRISHTQKTGQSHRLVHKTLPDHEPAQPENRTSPDRLSPTTESRQPKQFAKDSGHYPYVSVRTDIVGDHNDVRPTTAADLGLRRYEIHEARKLSYDDRGGPAARLRARRNDVGTFAEPRPERDAGLEGQYPRDRLLIVYTGVPAG